MSDLLFFEKPGCINNTRQKAILRGLGHQLVEVDLLRVSWTPASLRVFFGNRPVEQWFNPAAPRVKSGEVRPAYLDEAQALELMVADPLLVRRPLIQCGYGHTAGFDDDDPVLRCLGVEPHPDKDLQSCPRDSDESGHAAACTPSGGAS